MNDQLDVMKEVANISTGYAATALSDFLACGVSMKVPQASYFQLEDLPRLAPAQHQKWAAVYAPVNGEVAGGMFFIASIHSAQMLATQLLKGHLKHMSSSLEDDQLAHSAFQEVGNIVIGSYLTALSEIATVNCYPLVTELSIDFAGALLAEAAFYLAEDEQFVLMETTMAIQEINQKIDGLLLFIPDTDSVAFLIERLRMTYHDRA
ncbi:chemotaxis protein CheC [Shouchella patagoniensis]|uniref:chemotaxis protein CheC n=1 Tax=Shouchella patagoniensis TaxID=228576 RepID=UPI000995C75C|nr:chemotaxis protein CheC [Shouchella patagoniensis]